MFVNINDAMLPITVSSTPTAYLLPANASGVRIVNDATATVFFKLETSSTSTLAAPVSGTPMNASAVLPSSVERFDVSPTTPYISVYCASSAGTVYIQSVYGD